MYYSYVLVEIPVRVHKNRHILCVNDHFPNFIQIYTVPERTKKKLQEIVFSIFLKFVIASKFYSDRDPAFKDEIFQILMKSFVVK